MDAKTAKENLVLSARQNLNADDYMFGSCGREAIYAQLTGKPGDYGDSDIDLFFYSENNFNGWAARMRADGYSVARKRDFSPPSYGSDTSLVHEQYILKKDGLETVADIIYNNGKINTSPFKVGIRDADVNSLGIDKYGKIKSFFDDVNVKDAQKNIKNRRYRVLDKMDSARKEKLDKKGYKDMTTAQQSAGSNKGLDFMDRFKKNAEEAAYATAATQLSKGIKAGIIAALESSGKDSNAIQAARDLLDTKFGTMFVSGLVSLALMYAPGISEDERAQKLADKMQETGMADGLNASIDMILGLAMPAFTQAMSGLNAKLDTITPKGAPAAVVEEKVMVPVMARA